MFLRGTRALLLGQFFQKEGSYSGVRCGPSECRSLIAIEALLQRICTFAQPVLFQNGWSWSLTSPLPQLAGARAIQDSSSGRHRAPRRARAAAGGAVAAEGPPGPQVSELGPRHARDRADGRSASSLRSCGDDAGSGSHGRCWDEGTEGTGTMDVLLPYSCLRLGVVGSEMETEWNGKRFFGCSRCPRMSRFKIIS